MDRAVPHSARVWNYWLGGSDNFPVDRAVGDQVRAVFPGIVDAARFSRAFLRRAVGYLVGEAGVRQFLDVGSGLPTAENTHQVAQGITRDARIVYVDHDPLVLLHARALLTGTPRTQYVAADIRDADGIVRAAASTLDFDRPVALMLLGVMGHVEDHADARGIVSALVDRLPAGSYLVLSDGTSTSAAVIESHRQYNASGAVPYHLRSPHEIAEFFTGLDLVDPGVVPFTRWRPVDEPAYVDGYCGVARKP
jgi:O-methyltransferase involved in polyketide biosynthesis